jgi:hypothetical protein
MQIVFSTISGAPFAPALTLADKRRSLASVVREAADYTRPFVVAVIRRAQILKHQFSPEVLGQLISRPPESLHLLQKEWGKTRVSGADIVTITYLPGGGGGGGQQGGGQRKSGLAIGASIAAIALAIVAPYAIPALAAGLAGVAGISVATATIITQVAFAGVVIGLNYLASRAGRAKANKEGETVPLYGVSGGGNLARPGERIPVIYGRVWTTPPLSQADYVVNDGADQTLYKRMTIGCGKYLFKQIRVGTAIIWDEGVIPDSLSQVLAVEQIQPGAASVLVPGEVTSAPEVSGLELPRPDSLTQWAGPFRASAQGVQIRRIQIDYESPAVYANGPTGSKFAANIYPTTAGANFQYAQADSNGNPILPWIDVPNTALEGASRQALRRTVYVDVAPGQYVVRARNTSLALVWGGENSAYWSGLRGHVSDLATRPGVTELALRIKAAPGVPITAYSNIEVLVERILEVRRGGVYFEQATRKALDAAFDMARNADYGGGVSDNKIDWTKIDAYLSGVTSFDTFDGQINGPVSLWEAMAVILGPMRAEPRQFGEVLTFIRDEPSAVRKHHFTRRQILSGSTQFTSRTDRMDGASHLLNEYLVGGDPKRRQEALATYGPAPIARTRGALEGVSEHGHAIHLTRWAAASSFYRSRSAAFDVELNHRLVLPGDPCGVDVWYLTNTVAVGVESYSGNTLNLDCDLTLPEGFSGRPYGLLFDREGREFGPIELQLNPGRQVLLKSQDLEAAEASSGLTLAAVLGTEIDAVPAVLRVGTLDEVTESWIIQSVKPKSWSTATISCVNDAPEVWSAIGATLPPAPLPPSAMADPPVPTLGYVRGLVSQDGAALTLNWQVNRARGAVLFEMECSLDDEASWVPVSKTEAHQGQFGLPVLAEEVAQVALRARGYGFAGFPGPWVYGATPARALQLTFDDNDLSPEVRRILNGGSFFDAVAAGSIESLFQAKEAKTAAGAAIRRAEIVRETLTESLAGVQLELEAQLGAQEADYTSRIQTVSNQNQATAQSFEQYRASSGQAISTVTQRTDALATQVAAQSQTISTTRSEFDGAIAEQRQISQTLARGDLQAAMTSLGVTVQDGVILRTAELTMRVAQDDAGGGEVIELLVGDNNVKSGLAIRSRSGTSGIPVGQVDILGDRFRVSNPADPNNPFISVDTNTNKMFLGGDLEISGNVIRLSDRLSKTDTTSTQYINRQAARVQFPEGQNFSGNFPREIAPVIRTISATNNTNEVQLFMATFSDTFECKYDNFTGFNGTVQSGILLYKGEILQEEVVRESRGPFGLGTWEFNIPFVGSVIVPLQAGETQTFTVRFYASHSIPFTQAVFSASLRALRIRTTLLPLR